jgi:two-component system chemotaxis sensor kinase CheA
MFVHKREAAGMEMNGAKDITSTVPGIAEISKNYMDDFINEIKEILEDIELELVNLEVDPSNGDYLNSIYCSFHTIRGLAGLLNDGISGRIAIASEDLIEALRKYSTAAGKDAVNLILESVKFIRRIYNNPGSSEDTKFLGEVDQHINNIRKLKDDIILEVRQPMERETKIGEILVEEGAIQRSDVEDVLKKQSGSLGRMKFGEIVLREKKVDASDIIKAIRMQKVRNTGSADQYVKIPLDRLDQIIGIINNIGGIYDSVRDEAVLRFGSNDSLTIETTRAYNMINDMKNILKELRMVTLQQAFQKLTRSACSIIEENHLEVMFSTMGENMEVDKEIADRIVSPLGELIKLLLEKAYTEPDEDKRIGSIEVVAYEEGNGVHIDITGDALVDVDEFSSDVRYMEISSRLSALRCRLVIDDMEREGIRISIAIQR